MRLKNQVPTPRTAEDAEQIDLEPEQMTLLSQKQRKIATSSRRLVTRAHRGSRDADSEIFCTGSICQHGGKWTAFFLPVSVVWKETVLPLVYSGEYSEPMNFIIRDDKQLLPIKIGTVIGIEAFKSAGTLAIEVQEPSQRP